ncbi:Oat [Symbiodinium pilosum]|uniref:Oat protein n=1 Tax=Symbiodinium pilosum TaxID=2952 RepID=A0A812V3Y8_SYMPI|nr:Oat [Symbiodinium pilosum]
MEDETESEESDRDDGEEEVDNPANEEAAKREEECGEMGGNEDHMTADKQSRDSDTSATPEELRNLASSCCADGAAFLRKGELQEAVRKLVRGQALLERAEPGSADIDKQKSFAALQADIAGNLGICYRRLKDFGPAVNQLQLALQHHQVRLNDSDKVLILVDVADLRTLVAAHLNLASCHMESEAPDAALKHASTAAQLSGQVLTASRDSSEAPAGPAENDFAMLAVSFHKVAEAHEALKEWGKAIFAHTQAREVVQRSLGPNHPLTQSLARCRPHLSRPAAGNRQSEFLDAYAANIGRSTGCPLLRPGKGQVLPTIPQGARGKPFMRTTEALGFELVGYQMNSTCFPSWPPTNASNEEQEWYAMARARRHEAPPLPKLAIKQEPEVDNFPVIPPPSRSTLSRRGRVS